MWALLVFCVAFCLQGFPGWARGLSMARTATGHWREGTMHFPGSLWLAFSKTHTFKNRSEIRQPWEQESSIWCLSALITLSFSYFLWHPQGSFNLPHLHSETKSPPFVWPPKSSLLPSKSHFMSLTIETKDTGGAHTQAQQALKQQASHSY